MCSFLKSSFNIHVNGIFFQIVNKKRILGLLKHQTEVFGVKFISKFCGLIFADSISGETLKPNDFFSYRPSHCSGNGIS